MKKQDLTNRKPAKNPFERYREMVTASYRAHRTRGIPIAGLIVGGIALVIGYFIVKHLFY